MTTPTPVDRRILLGATLALPFASGAAAAGSSSLPIVELRRYRTRPGRRDELIDLFERQFVESQEAVGMTIVGTFREPSNPDRFTWVRGFTDMQARDRGLNAFYFGPVWKAHREQANACLADNDDVLLLREARPGSGFAPVTTAHPPAGAPLPHSVVTATICALSGAGDEAAAIDRFDRDLRPALHAAGAHVRAAFVREKAANSFPRLPVREDREVLVWFASYPNAAAHARAEARLAAVASIGVARETLVLAPTARSLLR